MTLKHSVIHGSRASAGRAPSFLDFKFVPATAKEAGAVDSFGDSGVIAGWATTADLDHSEEVIEAGAFSASIVKRGFEGPKGVKLLIEHNPARIAGKITKLEMRGSRLWIEAALNLKISYVSDVYEAAKMLGGLSFSVGFRTLKRAYVLADDGVNEYRVVQEADLWEVSIVTFPCNENATMEVVKSRPAQTPVTAASITDFEHSLVARGLVKNRNDARRITQVVKASAALFRNGPELTPVASPAPTNVAPRMVAEHLNALSAKVSELKALIAPDAK